MLDDLPQPLSQDRLSSGLDDSTYVLAYVLAEPDEVRVFTSGDGLRKGTLKIWENYLSPQDCGILFQKCAELKNSGIFTNDIVRRRTTYRSSVGFSDPGYAYSYNGGSHTGTPWPDWLLSLRNPLASRLRQPFEFALLTDFPSGKATLSAHTDSEPDMVEASIIACLSLGATRTLEIRGEKQKEILGSFSIRAGSLYTMEGEF